MSVKTMAKVWEMDMQPGEKLVLLAYADHADHDDTNMYPSIETIVKKTGYGERNVQRLTRALEAKGFLVPDGKGIHGTNKWRLGGGAILTGVQSTTEGGAIYDIKGVHPSTPEPSFTHPIIIKEEKIPQTKKDYVDLLIEQSGSEEHKKALLLAETYDRMDRGFRTTFARNKNTDVVVKFVIQQEAKGGSLDKFITWAQRDEFNASRIWEYAENPIKIKTRWQIAMSDGGDFSQPQYNKFEE